MRSKEQTDMTEQALPLTIFYTGWGVYQQNLVEIIAPLSPEQLALPASSHHWSIGMVAQHIVANRVWWFQGWMGEGSPDLAPIAHWDPGDNEEPPALASAELVAGFEATWPHDCRCTCSLDPRRSWAPFPTSSILERRRAENLRRTHAAVDDLACARNMRSTTGASFP